MPTLAAERRSLRDAIGAILRQDVLPERENPPFDRVCLDGVALSSAAVAGGARRFGLQATLGAGAVPPRLGDPSMAIEVMTGAVLPPGADCVVPLEDYDVEEGAIVLAPRAVAEPWRNVQRRGVDGRPGVAMLKTGQRLGAAELAVVASAGLAEVSVAIAARVAVVSTGDELVEPGLPIAGHQVRRSNAYAILAALRAHGGARVSDEHLPDDEARTRERLGQLLEGHDVLVLSGGVSKGKFDFVPGALRRLGVAPVIEAIDQRPGRPMWFGVGPRGQAVFGLPGNPVATLVCLVRYVLPALEIAAGALAREPQRIALGAGVQGRGITQFVPVVLRAVADGATVGLPRPPNGSGDFLALAGTDGFVELPPRPEGHAAGVIADFHRW